MPATRVRIFPDPASGERQAGNVFIGVSLKAGLLHRPKALQEVFAWTQNRFGAFSLLLGDHLNRHNYAAFEGMAETDAESKATAEGDAAAALLKQIIDASPLGATPILRASELVLTPNYLQLHDRLVQHLRADARFRDLIQQGVDVFMARTAVTPESRARVEPHCVAYQLEELAIFEILADTGYRTLVYPGAHLPVMKALACGQLKNVSAHLEAMTLIEIRTHGGSK